MKKLLIFALALVTTGCVETTINSSTDPAFVEKKYQTIAVSLNKFAPSIRLEAEPIIRKNIESAGVISPDIRKALPPTRSMSVEQTKAALITEGIEAVLDISISENNEKSSYIGTYTTGTAITNWSNDFAYTYGSSFNQPIIARTGKYVFSAVLIDVKSGNIAWEATLLTKAGGTAFVGNIPAITQSFSEILVKHLRQDGKI